MNKVSLANKGVTVLVVCLMLVGMVSQVVAQPAKVSAYNDFYVHKYMSREGVKVLPADSRARQELETVAGGKTYVEWLADGAYDEDQTDHLYPGLTQDLIGVRAIPHYWDADRGPDAQVKDLSGHFDIFPNANEKASLMFYEALLEYHFGDRTTAYERLGHVAHLLADQTVPCHAHIDFHPGYHLELTDLARKVWLDNDSWADDSYEFWIYDDETHEGAYKDYTAQSAIDNGGMVQFPDEVIARSKELLKTEGGGAWKYLLYYLMYTTNQRADYFASDDFDGDTNDPEGWMEGYSFWPDKTNFPTNKEDLDDNDHGLLGETLNDDNNNDDGDLARIEANSYVYGIRAISTLLQLFYECTHAPEPVLEISYADQDGDGNADYRYVNLDVTYVGGDLGYHEGLEVRFANGNEDPVDGSVTWGAPGDWRPVGAASGGFRVPWVLSHGDGVKAVSCELRNLAGLDVTQDTDLVTLAEIGVPQIFNYDITAEGAGLDYYYSTRVDFYVTEITCDTEDSWPGDDYTEFYFEATVDDGYDSTIASGGYTHQEPSSDLAYNVPAGGWLYPTQVCEGNICYTRAENTVWIHGDDCPWDWSAVASVYVLPGQTVRLKTHGYDHDPLNPDDDMNTVYTPILSVPTEVGEHVLLDAYCETRRNGEVNEHYTLRVRAVATVVDYTWSKSEQSDPENPGWVQYGQGWQDVVTSTLLAPEPETTTWDASVLDNPVVDVKMVGAELWARVTGEPDTVIAGLSPVNLLVTDPDGFRVGIRTETQSVYIPMIGFVDLTVERTYAEIPGSTVLRQIDWDRDGDLENFDLDGDGDADTLIVIDSRHDGDYQIQATPPIGAAPTSTYSIAVATMKRPYKTIGFSPILPWFKKFGVVKTYTDPTWRTGLLVESALVSDMPSEAFVLQSDGNGLNLPPQADANGPYWVAEGTAVAFDASGSSDPEGTSLTYRWDFESDGTWDTDWSASPTASHTWYDDWPGQAMVEVSDGTESATSTAAVQIYNEAPSVDLGADKLAAPGEEVQFSGTFTDPGTADTHTIQWDFGDGTGTTGTLAPTHAYSQPGEYTVTMTVTDDNGGIGRDTLTVNTGVKVSIDPLQMVVPPGHRFEYEVAVHNLGNVEDTYNLDVGGLDPAWYSLSQTSITTYAGQTVFVTLELCPPTSAPFGIYPFAVVASSQTDPAIFDVADGQAEVGTGEYLGEEVIPPSAPTLMSPADETVTNDSTVDLDWTEVTDPSPLVNYEVQVDNNDDFSSPEYDSGWIMGSDAATSALPDDTYYWRARASDGLANVGEWSAVWQFMVDTTPPSVAMVSPLSGYALQDGVTFIASAIDDGSGVAAVTFSIREADGGDGIPIGYDDIPAIQDPATGNWSLWFDTLQVPDGYYVVVVKATDNAGNIGSITVPYSIRNWAVLELLPETPNNKAGRTMPVKFSLRVSAAVDPAQPFVYNEELTIKIFATSNPGTILQTSVFGTGSTNYRIDTSGEKYITNFKTSKVPMMYTVEIWRTGKSFLVGSFTFKTVK
jgi:PKD repeat protein